MHQQHKIVKQWIVVLLALATGSASQMQTPVAQAAASDASLNIYLSAERLGGEGIICVGDKVPIQVKVLKKVGVEGDYSFGRLIGVQVSAFVDGSGIGRISPPKNTTRLSSDPVGATFFLFTAEKSGTVAVVFQGKVNTRVLLGLEFGGNTVTASQSLTVEECQYTVTTISRFSAAGVNIVATMDAKMKLEADGTLSGTGIVNWVGASVTAGDCSSVITIAPSQAELTGVLDDDYVIVDVTYLAAALTNVGGCPGGVNDQAEVLPDPVTVSIPASGGGQKGIPQNLNEPNFYSMYGSLVIFVSPAKKP